MQLNNLLNDNDAVSPVIGVILMVAITVILAAVIGTFVLGLGDQVSDSAPQASFSFEQTTYDITTGNGLDFKAVKITHDGGDSIDGSNINILVDGVEAYAAGSSDTIEDPFTSELTAGSSTTIVAATSSSVTTGTDKFTEDTSTSDGDPEQLDTDNGVNGVELTSDQEVRVIWSSSSGSDTATLGKFTVN